MISHKLELYKHAIFCEYFCNNKQIKIETFFEKHKLFAKILPDLGKNLHEQCSHVHIMNVGTLFVYVFSRPGQSQGLLYKHLHHSLIKWVGHDLLKYLYSAATP